MRSLMVPAAVAVALFGLGTFPAAAWTSAGHAIATAAGSDISRASNSQHRPHYRGYGRRYHQARVPQHLRGFEDPGYALRGNVNGCAVDLGYGRWEPCGNGR